MLEILVKYAEIWIPSALILIALGLAFLKSNLKICPPNQVLIFSGKQRKVNGKEIGYRFVKGGRGFRWPIFEAVYSMSLETMPVEMEVIALTEPKISITVKAIANIKIAGSQEEGLANAVERFLGKGKEEIALTARQTLEGSCRGVFTKYTPEQINSDRLNIASEIVTDAKKDFEKLGLVIDTFKIQSLSDSIKYFEAIGRKKNALIQKEAKITEAQAEADTREKVASEKQRGSVAEIEANKIIEEKNNDLRVLKAKLAAQSNQEEAKASVIGKIAQLEEEKTLEEVRIQLNENRYCAEVIVPAKAEKEANELKAKGNAAQILENGIATAEAINLLHQQWQKGDVRELFLLQQLPNIIDKITNILSDNLNIERLTIVDNGKDSGLPKHMRGLTGSVAAVFEEVKTATGLDIPDLLHSAAKENDKK